MKRSESVRVRAVTNSSGRASKSGEAYTAAQACWQRRTFEEIAGDAARDIGVWLSVVPPELRPTPDARFAVCEFVWRSSAAGPRRQGLTVNEALHEIIRKLQAAGHDDQAQRIRIRADWGRRAA